MGEEANAYRVSVGKTERQRTLGTTRPVWHDDVKMYLTEVQWEGVDWINLAQGRDK
jgi:hypothetical protein